MKRSTSAKATIASNFSAISRRVIPRIAPFRKMFSRPVSSGWNPVPTSRSEATRPRVRARRLRAAGEDLEQRRLAGAVAADDADHFAPPDLERHVVERPEIGGAG